MTRLMLYLSLASVAFLSCTLVVDSITECNENDDFCADGYHCQGGECVPTGDDSSCSYSSCNEDCRTRGFSRGQCAGDECVCSGGGADGDADADADGDADSDTTACTNADDGAAISAEIYGADGDLSYADVTSGCGQACALDPDPRSCTLTCLQDATGYAASIGCALCFVDQVICAIMNCLAPCMADPAGDPCFECRCGDNAAMVNCMGDFESCSGLTLSTPCP